MRSHSQKWLTLAVMLLVTAATVYGTLHYGAQLQELGRSYGPAGHPPRMYRWGAEIVVCIAVWLAAYLLCAAIQRTMDVWQGFNLLPVLLLAVIAVNFGPQLAQRVGIDWPVEVDRQTVQSLENDYVAQLAMDNNACQAEFAQLEFPKFMRPVSLGTPKGPKSARTKLQAARVVEQSCQNRDQAEAAKFRASVAALHADTATTQQVLDDVAKNGVETNLRQLRQIESDLLAEYERMLDDLAASKAGWYADGYDMAFYNKRDLHLFRSHVAKVKKLTDDRDAVNRKLWEKTATAGISGN